MTRLRVLPVVVLAYLCIPYALPAQEQEAQPIVTEGSRVRVTSPLLEGRLVGSVMAIDGNQLVIDPVRAASPEVRLSTDRIDKLEVSVGKKSVLGRSMAIGFGAGFAFGFLGGIAGGEAECCSAVEVGAITGVFFGLIGTGIGALAGSKKRDRWEEVNLSQLQPVVSLIPKRSHSPTIRIGLRLRI